MVVDRPLDFDERMGFTWARVPYDVCSISWPQFVILLHHFMLDREKLTDAIIASLLSPSLHNVSFQSTHHPSERLARFLFPDTSFWSPAKYLNPAKASFDLPFSFPPRHSGLHDWRSPFNCRSRHPPMALHHVQLFPFPFYRTRSALRLNRKGKAMLRGWRQSEEGRACVGEGRCYCGTSWCSSSVTRGSRRRVQHGWKLPDRQRLGHVLWKGWRGAESERDRGFGVVREGSDIWWWRAHSSSLELCSGLRQDRLILI